MNIYAKITAAIVAMLIIIFCIYTVQNGYVRRTVKRIVRAIDGKTPILGKDGRNYYVLADKPKQQKASELIETINQFIIDFIVKLKQKYLYNEKTCFAEPQFNPDDEFVPYAEGCSAKNPLTDFKYRAVYLLVTRYRPNFLEENQPTSPADTSWEEGKGERIALCLREQISGNYDFIDIELIKFVAIHELTHIAANTLQHPYYFWKIFKFLLNEANLLMGYQLVNYQFVPANYCGMIVTYNPIYDDLVNIQANEDQDIVNI